MADTVCILLSNSTTGVKRNSKNKKEQLNVRKGELVIKIPKKDQIVQHEGVPSHNYLLLLRPNVSFYDTGVNIIPLQRAEADYLEGIANPTARILEYRKEQRFQWIMNLRTGDMVFFKLGINKGSKVPIYSKGIIRYYGAVEGRNGVAFGIEIMSPEHKGKGSTDGHPYFKCNHNDGVFVSMYEIITAVEEPSSGGDRTDPGKKPITQEPTGGPPANHTRSKIEGDYQDEPHKRVPVGSSDTFFLNDRVVVQNVKGKAIPGTVRWGGQMTAAGKVVVPVVIGMETERPVDLKKEFPDIHLGMTGNHGQQLFDLERGKDHGRLFLPEPLVLHAEQYAKQKQEEGTFDAQEAKKWGMSLDEYREQMQIVAETENKKESQEETSAAGVGALDDHLQHQQRQEELERQRRARELENAPEDEKFESHVGQNRPREQQPSSLPSPRTADHNNTSSPNHNRFHRSHNDQHPGYPPRQDQYNPNYYYPPANQHHDQYGNQQQNHPTYDQHRTPPPPSHRSDYHDRQFDDRSNPVPIGQQLQEYALTHSGNSTSYDYSQFTKGTLVKVQGFEGLSLTGTIQWIGTLPGHEGLYAGVELDQVLHGCSDGIFQGRRYFTCPPDTGFFCLLSSLQLDDRYMEPNQVPAAKTQDMINPIQAPQYDYNDTPGGPELFSRYIGDKHGIQGHYNSCYLDATVFGLFALSDSFDMMLLEEPKSEIGQKIMRILWKGIVNPLRRFGVARFESIMELRNELENLGRMKGANKDEKDPEEFLNLLFKEILHVDPFISIKRPFGVENEFFVQLFLEIEQDQAAPPSSEKLIRKMFHEQNISFTTVPSKLLLQMPCFGKEFKMFSKIIPALEMDVEPLLDTESRLDGVTKFSKMQLLSVICIETSHYVCFTRTKDRWLFHDSMANRLYDTYNIPKVTDVSEELSHWVYTPRNQKKLLQTSPRDIPECVRRFTEDIYMCVYINPNLDRYGLPSSPMEDQHHISTPRYKYDGTLKIHDPSHNQSDGIGIQNKPDKMTFDQFTRNQQELNKTKEECKILEQSQKELEKNLKHRIAEHETTKRNMRTLQDTYRQEKETVLIEKERIVAEKEMLIAEIAEKEGVIAEMKQTAENFAQSWKINHKDVTLTATELGRGGWGYIRVGMFREQRVAVKQLYKIIMSEKHLAMMNREINTMSRLRHPNLLLFIGAVLDHPSGNPLIITEIMDTSLRSAYEKGQITEESVKLSILRDTASALNYLHCHPAGAIIHRDVSSANVLLETRGTNQWRAKLSDFGSANEARKAVTKLQGAEVYSAPESFVSVVSKKKSPQTIKMDVFSFGVLMCEVMVYQFPDHEKFDDFLKTISISSPSIHRLINECISEDPSDRPTMKIIIGRINVK